MYYNYILHKNQYMLLDKINACIGLFTNPNVYFSKISLEMYDLKNIYVSELHSIDLKPEKIYIEYEPYEIKQYITKNREARHCILNENVPICLQYKIQQNIKKIAELAEFCYIDDLLNNIVLNPHINRYSQLSGLHVQATFCVKCGNYLVGANRSRTTPSRRLAIRAQCSCTDYKFYTEYVCDIYKLINFAKSNITVENSAYYTSDIMLSQINIIKYNQWCKCDQNGISIICPYASLSELVGLYYSESESETDMEFDCDTSSVGSLFVFGDEIRDYEISYVSDIDD